MAGFFFFLIEWFKLMLAQTDKHYVKMRTLHVTRERKVDQGWCVFVRGEQIRFGSVFTRKKQPNRKKKRETRNRTGTGRFRSGFVPVFWPVPVSFRFFIQKTGQTYRLILGFLIGFLMGFVMGF